MDDKLGQKSGRLWCCVKIWWRSSVPGEWLFHSVQSILVTWISSIQWEISDSVFFPPKINTKMFHPNYLVIRELECVDKPFPTCMESSGFETDAHCCGRRMILQSFRLLCARGFWQPCNCVLKFLCFRASSWNSLMLFLNWWGRSNSSLF